MHSVFSERSAALLVSDKWRHTKMHTSAAKALENESDLIYISRKVHKPFEGVFEKSAAVA